MTNFSAGAQSDCSDGCGYVSFVCLLLSKGMEISSEGIESTFGE